MRLLAVGDFLIVSALRALGHEVEVLGGPDVENKRWTDSREFFVYPETAPQSVQKKIASFKPDALLVGDDSSPLLHLGLEEIDLPKLWWSVDTHLHSAWHRHFAPVFHHVFAAQENRQDILRHAGGPGVSWLPLFSPRERLFIPWNARRHDVAFVGTLDANQNPARVALIRALEKRLPLVVKQGNYAPVYSHSKLVLNQGVADDLNFRAFEAMGCGAVLLTEDLNHSLHALGEPGVDYLTYPKGDAEACRRAAESALQNPEALAVMARRGWEKINACHLAEHRAQTVSSRVQEILGQTTPRKPDPLYAADHLAIGHWKVAGLDLPPLVTDFFSRRAVQLAERNLKQDAAWPWSRLTLASKAFEANDSERVGKLLAPVFPSDDKDFLKEFIPLRVLGALALRDRVEAKTWLDRGREFFPNHPAWPVMEKRLT